MLEQIKLYHRLDDSPDAERDVSVVQMHIQHNGLLQLVAVNGGV